LHAPHRRQLKFPGKPPFRHTNPPSLNSMGVLVVSKLGSTPKARGNWYVRYFEDRVVNGAVQHVRIATQIEPVTTRGKRPPKSIED